MRKIKGYFSAQTVSGSCKIDMRFMLRNGYIVKGKKLQGVLSWTNSGDISFVSCFNDDEKYLRLMYIITDSNEQEYIYDYQIEIDEVDSNLGKGKILYFLCPDSGWRSKILHKAYGEHRFINREYYETKYGLRIYYPTQKADKNHYHNDRYHSLKRKVDNLEVELKAKHRNSHYKGKPIKEHLKLQKMKSELSYLDHKRLVSFNAMFNNKFNRK